MRLVKISPDVYRLDIFHARRAVPMTYMYFLRLNTLHHTINGDIMHVLLHCPVTLLTGLTSSAGRMAASLRKKLLISNKAVCGKVTHALLRD